MVHLQLWDERTGWIYRAEGLNHSRIQNKKIIHTDEDVGKLALCVQIHFDEERNKLYVPQLFGLKYVSLM